MAVDDSYTVSLFHFEGADGGTVFIDESGKTWAATGAAQYDTAQFKFGYTSLLLDGSGDYISTGDSADWYLDDGSDSNSWTFDAQIRFNGAPGATEMGLWQQFSSAADFTGFRFAGTASGLRFVVRSAASNVVDIANAWTPSAGTWYHIALVKQGTIGYKMFVDGTQIGTTQTDTTPLVDRASDMRIGRYTASDASNKDFNGWIDEVRFSKGIARWTTNFTPPIREYGANEIGGKPVFANFGVV